MKLKRCAQIIWASLSVYTIAFTGFRTDNSISVQTLQFYYYPNILPFFSPIGLKNDLKK
jgi:hypothetical protein